MATSQITNQEIYGRDFKLKDNERLLAKSNSGDWFLLKRVGQRSWEAVCVAEKERYHYESNNHQTIHGNSRDLLSKVDAEVGIAELYSIYGVKEYRQAMMSIMVSGRIDSIVEVEFTKMGV